MKVNPICDECGGSKGEYREDQIVVDPSEQIVKTIRHFTPCYYCAGTGYATDEDDFVPIIRWEE